MTFKTIIRKFTLVAAMAFIVSSASAQDLLANRAPVDRRTASPDTVSLMMTRMHENLDNPSGNLYDNWDNAVTHKSFPLPESYKIDLRDFHMPTPSRVITSNFGPRWGRRHQGLDIKVYIGDTIRAAFSGKVRIVKYNANGYGKYIVIRHNNGLETIYGHLSKQLVSVNQNVKAGQVIGLGGNTGRSTGSHLHFETRLCGKALNPALFFDFPHQDVTGDFYTYRQSTYDRESAAATIARGKASSLPYSKENIQGKPSQKNDKNVDNDEANRNESNEPTRREETTWYKVQQDETLESIAQKHNTTVENLCKKNRIGRYTKLSAGQMIQIS